MRICFYSPYIPEHFGGGEKHLFDVALSASRFHQVTIGIRATKVTTIDQLANVKNRYQKLFNYDLSAISFVTIPIGTDEPVLKKLLWTSKFDALYYVTDGSLFFSIAKHNYLHIQIPFTNNKEGYLERIKLQNWQEKNTNSYFTKKIIEKAWQTKINQVIEPQVDLQEFESKSSKEKIILNVGRFFKQLHAKRQDILIEAFKRLLKKNPTLLKGWKLILVGAIEDQEYVLTLKKLSKNLPIEILDSLNRSELVDLYKKSSIYWHATGFEVDETEHPEKVEHFGISTVEAMAAGSIPLVQYKGGQKEILGSELEQLGWLTVDECVDATEAILVNTGRQNELRRLVTERAKAYSKSIFDKKIEKLFAV